MFNPIQTGAHLHHYPKEKGQTIDFGGEKIMIHDVSGNLAVFSTEDVVPRKYRIENVNDEGHLLGINFEKRKELYPDFRAFTSTASIDQEVYDIFVSNPEISETDFGNAIHNHLLNKLRNPETKQPKITVSKQLGPIDNLVLYQQLEPQKHLLQFTL